LIATTTVLTLILIIPTLGACYNLASGQQYKSLGAKLACLAMLVSWIGIIGLIPYVLLHGTIHETLFSWRGISLLGLLVDRLSVVMLALVATVSLIIHVYSRRAMQGEPRYKAFFAWLSLVTVAVMFVIVADNLLLLSIAWALKGLILSKLIDHYDDREASRQAARLKRRTDLIGVSAFALAIALAWRLFGTLDINTINNHARLMSSQPQLVFMTMLLLIAAMVKSAQVPFQQWLPASLEAPTPVSAMMHAGLINAGGFLIVRLSFLFSATPLTMTVATIVGGTTAIYGTMVMLTRSDVKNTLVYSTMGQMGFMLLECGLGAYSIAIVHLVAHGIYKATLFLGSADVLRQRNIERKITDQAHQQQKAVRGWIGDMILSIGTVLIFGGIFIFHGSSNQLLLVFAWETCGMGIITMRQSVPSARLLLTMGLILAGCMYLFVLTQSEHYFAAIVAPSPTPSPLLLSILALIILVIHAANYTIHRKSKQGWLLDMSDRLYIFALHRGYIDDLSQGINWRSSHRYRSGPPRNLSPRRENFPVTR